MAVTAKARAQTALHATTALTPSDALAVVKQAASSVKGGGASLMTSGVVNAGAQVHVEQEHPDWLALSINSGKRLVELCTFSAVTEATDGTTTLWVGGLDTYKTSQSRLLGFIPIGPASITGFSLYKRFLDEISARLQAQDPTAGVTVGIPES